MQYCLLKKLSKTALFLMMATGVQAEVAYIAGTAPYERPVGAPVITEFNKDANWYKTALQGVSKPYPYSLHFLEDQGQWFTPFIHSGMNPKYDIRQWHSLEE